MQARSFHALCALAAALWLLPAWAARAAESEEGAGPARSRLRQAVDDVTLRYFTEADFLEDSDDVWNNLLRLHYKGFALGFERDDENRKEYGAIIPVGTLLGELTDRPLRLDVAYNHSDLGSEDEDEVIVYWKASDSLEVTGVWEVLARWFNTPHGSANWAMSMDWRRQANVFDHEIVNYGFGIQGATGGIDNETSAYAWAMLPQAPLGGFFLGGGRFHRDWRLMAGRPNKEGFAWRYFRIDSDNGFVLNEFIFSTDAMNIGVNDYYFTLNNNKIVDSFTTGGGTFAYTGLAVPPINARGRGITGEISHRRIPFIKRDFLNAELDVYFGNVFVGARYNGGINGNYDDGTVALPVGYQFSGGDALTRNFLRVEPFYNRGLHDTGVIVRIEAKL